MAIKNLLDKLTGKAKREEEARLAAEALAEKQRRKEEAAEKRRLKREAEEAKKVKSPKDIATENGDPWVQVLSMEIDSENPGAGAFELDWNDIFVARLLKSGYQGKTDQDIVDNWFQDVCRNVVLETFEQEQADPQARTTSNKRDLGNGRTEVS